MSDSKPDLSEYKPRVEFFENTITEGNRNCERLVRVSFSGQLVHLIDLKDPSGAVEKSERRVGISAAEVNNLLGRVLTLTDASFADPAQRKAFKDVLRQTIREWLTENENSAMASAGIGGWIGRPFNEAVDLHPETLTP